MNVFSQSAITVLPKTTANQSMLFSTSHDTGFDAIVLHAIVTIFCFVL